MPLLEQQELVEVPPARRLIVPGGHSAHWGIDPSSKRIALAGVSKGEDGSLDRWVECVPFMPSQGAPRLSEIYWRTFELCAKRARMCRPGFVFVEQPSGKQENPALSYAVGVTICAVYDALLKVTGVPVLVETVTSSAWKKKATGYGAIYKPKRKGDEYGVLTWARSHGYTGTSWDEADAIGIAEAARRTVALEVR